MGLLHLMGKVSHRVSAISQPYPHRIAPVVTGCTQDLRLAANAFDRLDLNGDGEKHNPNYSTNFPVKMFVLFVMCLGVITTEAIIESVGPGNWDLEAGGRGRVSGESISRDESDSDSDGYMRDLEETIASDRR